MASLKMRRIDLTASDGRKQLAKFRDLLRHDADTNTTAGKKLSQAAFGSILSPTEAVARICTDVQTKGTEAVLKYTEAFDKVKLKADALRVPAAELEKAHRAADPAFLDALRRIRYNIDSFQSGLLHRDAELLVRGSHELHLRYRPLKRVGVYCPGGAAAYPSTLLMTVCPALAAGVGEIVVCMPPKATGAYNTDMLATCFELGVSEVYRVGGAQAIAAMAYGTPHIPAVDMIVGPGNQFIALAKKHVYGQVGIDCLAGQTEVLVTADDSAHPRYVALDLINDMAPEHLHLQIRDVDAFADEIEHAGAIFIGPFTPVALGDYSAGPSHVLPTGGTARFSSGLNANDFRRRTSVLRFTKNGMKDFTADVVLLANKEGLAAHAASIEERSKDNGPAARPKPKPERAGTTPAPLKK